jgi:ABC-2 type transport system permease protein
MKKLLLIGLKDLTIIFRDRAALMFMLLAPFLLTLGLGFVTGRFSGNSNSGLQDIPVVLVNLDQGDLGNALVDAFNSDELKDLTEATELSDPQAARRLIDNDQAVAAVIIPDGFSESIIPTSQMISAAEAGDQSVMDTAVQIEIYANPGKPTGAGVIKAIVDEFISRVEEGRISGVTSFGLLDSFQGKTPTEIEAEVRKMFENADESTFESTSIQLKTENQGAEATDFDPLAYMAPGMALMFLMYTVSYGGRSILAERNQGTLPRLMVSPTTSTQILGGKVLGIFLTGVAQMGILIVASALFFGVQWGDPLGMTVLILVAVFGATGWGMLITALARTPGQVGAMGSAVMLIFGILGGSFIQLDVMPAYVRLFSVITPNAWGLDGFQTLALGGTLANLGRPIAALMVMGAILFGVSMALFGRSSLMGK